MRADADLPWYFCTGPSTLAGDAGLRSTLGAQIAHMQASKLSDEASRARAALRSAPWRRVDDPRWEPEPWQRNPHPQGAVDVSESEDDMIQRLSFGALATEIKARLGVLSTLHVRALRLHYSGESLPYDVDPAAVLLDVARRACRVPTEPTLAALRKALERLNEVDRSTMTIEAKAVVRAAQLAYESAPIDRVRRLPVYDPRGWRDDVREARRVVTVERCASGKVWYEDVGG